MHCASSPDSYRELCFIILLFFIILYDILLLTLLYLLYLLLVQPWKIQFFPLPDLSSSLVQEEVGPALTSSGCREHLGSEGMAWPSDSQTIMHRKYLGVSLKPKFWSLGLEQDLRSCLPNKLPGDAGVASSRAPFWVAKGQLTSGRSRLLGPECFWVCWKKSKQ